VTNEVKGEVEDEILDEISDEAFCQSGDDEETFKVF